MEKGYSITNFVHIFFNPFRHISINTKYYIMKKKNFLANFWYKAEFNLILGLLFFLPQLLQGQSGNVGIGTSTPAASAILDVTSTEKGVLIPRMNKIQRDAISSPTEGLLIYQSDNIPGFYYYSGTNWVSLTGFGPGGNTPSTCIDFDGNAYPTITIGTQTWMAENLRVTHYRNGDEIPNVTNNAVWTALTSGAHSWYNNDQSTNAKYGILYNWYALNDSRGVCPHGWHAATRTEWNELETYLGGTSVAGGKLKAVTPLYNNPNSDATNCSGFFGLPGGYRSNNGPFDHIGVGCNWWTSTETSSTNSWYRSIGNGNGILNEFDANKKSGCSIRCVRD